MQPAVLQKTKIQIQQKMTKKQSIKKFKTASKICERQEYLLLWKLNGFLREN